MSVTDGSGAGLLVVATGARLLETNALHYDWRALGGQRHLYQIPALDATVISANYASRGTGGASCGPDTSDVYKIYAGDKAYSFTLVPISGGETADAGDTALLYRDEFAYELLKPDYDYAIRHVAVDEAAVSVSFGVGDDSQKLDAATIIVAVYNAAGRLTGQKAATVELDGTGIYTRDFTLDAPLAAGDTLKVFAWSPAYVPLCDPYLSA
jgi:hypothetical protein